MWEPRRLTTLWASKASCRDSFTFYPFQLKGKRMRIIDISEIRFSNTIMMRSLNKKANGVSLSIQRRNYLSLKRTNGHNSFICDLAVCEWIIRSEIKIASMFISGQESRINDRGDPLRWPRDTLYPLKLALTSPTSGGRSVGIVRLRTKGHGV
jgi:hypothetical protein